MSQEESFDSESNISEADEEDNIERNNEFKFNECLKSKQNKYFRNSSFEFKSLKKIADKDFLKDTFIGHDEGIDIFILDNPDLYNQ